MILLPTQVAQPEVNDPWRRRLHNDASGEIGVLGDDGQPVLFGVVPQLAVGRVGPQRRRRDGGQSRRKGELRREILVEEPTLYATGTTE